MNYFPAPLKPVECRRVGSVPGVTPAKVDFKTQRAVVVFDGEKATPDVLTNATADAGFRLKIARLQ